MAKTLKIVTRQRDARDAQVILIPDVADDYSLDGAGETSVPGYLPVRLADGGGALVNTCADIVAIVVRPNEEETGGSG